MTDSSSKAFPFLSESEIAALAQWGHEKRFREGEALFREGERKFPFFVVLEGEVRIEESSSGQRQAVTVHRAGEFTGDVDMLTGRPAFVSAVAQGECRVLQIEAGRLSEVLNGVPSLGEKFLEAFQSRRLLLTDSRFKGIQVVGPAQRTQAIRVFLYKNSAPFTWIDPDQPQPDEMPPGIDLQRLPAVVCGKDRILHQPTLRRLAECIGILRPIPDQVFDLVVVGAGPGGLAAAVYAASEGLSTLVLDRLGPGGQAGTTSKIENFIGFPSGLSGGELASRTYLQILKFGGIVSAPVEVESMQFQDELYRLRLDDASEVRSDCVLLATGVKYRRLPIPGVRELEDAGVYYAATSVEARVCRQKAVAVVGGGNSAGQAAMFLSEHAASVRLLVRGGDLGKSMSNYLAERIGKNPRIEVCLHSELRELQGEDQLEAVAVTDNRDGSTRKFDCDGLFIFIGSVPNTDWLPDSVELDEKGYIISGPQAGASPKWPLERQPCALETTAPGIFAAGDVRNQATRRVAFAAGDGALAVTCIHQYRSGLRR